MPTRIRSFGGETHGHFCVTNGEEQSVDMHREIWFDQDIDGHWLVWASERDPNALSTGDESPEDMGAIVVTDPAVGAFLGMLGELIAYPSHYDHEPTFPGPPGEPPGNPGEGP
jgi:hypothetical protein